MMIEKPNDPSLGEGTGVNRSSAKLYAQRRATRENCGPPSSSPGFLRESSESFWASLAAFCSRVARRWAVVGAGGTEGGLRLDLGLIIGGIAFIASVVVCATLMMIEKPNLLGLPGRLLLAGGPALGVELGGGAVDAGSLAQGRAVS
jgi:hypothetical protein